MARPKKVTVTEDVASPVSAMGECGLCDKPTRLSELMSNQSEGLLLCGKCTTNVGGDEHSLSKNDELLKLIYQQCDLLERRKILSFGPLFQLVRRYRELSK